MMKAVPWFHSGNAGFCPRVLPGGKLLPQDYEVVGRLSLLRSAPPKQITNVHRGSSYRLNWDRGQVRQLLRSDGKPKPIYQASPVFENFLHLLRRSPHGWAVGDRVI